MIGGDRPRRETDDLGTERGATEIIIGALAGSALLPFVQAIATRAGGDVYNLIRGRFSRRGQKRAETEIREAGTITLADQNRRVILQVPETISPAMAARLDSVRLPVPHDGWLLVTWNAGLAQWLVEECANPPPTTNILE